MQNKLLLYFYILLSPTLILCDNSIQIKINTSPPIIDGRDWIAIKNGKEISNIEFWKLLGKDDYVNYWKKEKRKKLLRPIKLSMFTFMSFSSFFLASKEEVYLENNFGNYSYTEYNAGEYWYASIPLGIMGIYELFKWLDPITDPVSYYDILPLVNEYNNNLISIPSKLNNE